MLIIWRLSPCLRLLLPLVIGILCQINFSFSSAQWLWFTAPSGLLHLWVHFYIAKANHSFRFTPGITASLMMIGLGGLLTCAKPELHRGDYYQKHYITENLLLLRICEAPIAKERSMKAVAEVIGVKKGDTITPTSGLILCYIATDTAASMLQVDDVIMTTANVSDLNEVQNPFEFNYKKYLHSHFIYQQLYARSDQWKLVNRPESHSFMGWFISCREGLLKQFKHYGIGGQEYAVLAALILGKTDAIDFELMSSYASAGAIHVLAVSGLHVGLIYVLLAPLLRFIFPGKGKRVLKFIIPTSILWIYAGLTGFSPSVLRAAVMFTAFIIAESFERKSSVYNTMSASALVLLCWNPYMIMEVGFQLSYLAVLGIVILQKRIVNLWTVRNRWTRKLWELTAVSLAAQISTFALGMLYFHQFPVWFLVSNLVVIPLSTLILYGGLAFLLLSWLPPVAQVLAHIIAGMTWLMNSIVSWFDQLPASIIQGISLTVFETYILFGIVWCVCRWWLWRKSKAMIYALAFSLLLCVMQVVEKTSIVQFSEMCVHNIAGHTCITYTRGEEGYVFYDKELVSNESRVRFHLKNYWNHLGIKNFHFIAIDNDTLFNDDDVVWNYPVLQAGNKTLVIATEGMMHDIQAIKPDFILLGQALGKVYLDESDLENFSKSTVIVADGLSKKKQQFLENELASKTALCKLQEGAVIIRGDKVMHHGEVY